MAETERQANITIEAAPDGLHVRVEYTGALATIPAAIERLRAAGVLELVSASRPAPAAPQGGKAKAQRVEPAYDGNGDPICPVHRKPLSEGRYGLYCSAKARGDEAASQNGYCSLRFTQE
jgi:hypothetical protein